jgi:hypothetical protein
MRLLVGANVEKRLPGPTYWREASAPGAGTTRSADVKYILLIYQNPATWETFSEEERNRVMVEVGEIMEELTQSGEWVGGEGLADPSNTKTVRVRDGVPVVTDGPFVESKEQLAGYCIVECETPERATEIAARWPDARYWAMEVRPIMEPGGEEM